MVDDTANSTVGTHKEDRNYTSNDSKESGDRSESRRDSKHSKSDHKVRNSQYSIVMHI